MPGSQRADSWATVLSGLYRIFVKSSSICVFSLSLTPNEGGELHLFLTCDDHNTTKRVGRIVCNLTMSGTSDIGIQAWEFIVGKNYAGMGKWHEESPGVLHLIWSSPDVGKVKYPIKRELRKHLGPEFSRKWATQLQPYVKDLNERPSGGYYTLPQIMMPIAAVKRTLIRHVLNKNFTSGQKIYEVAKKWFLSPANMPQWNFSQPKRKYFEKLIL